MTATNDSRTTLRRRVIGQLLQLNFYTDEDSLIIAEQRLATRIYLILLSISLVFLFIYSGSSVQTRVMTVKSPTQNTFEQLSVDYPSSLSCACSKISISYDQFLDLNPTYHQVCSSKFIQPEWFVSLFNMKSTDYYPLDFRNFASSHFQVLALLCNTSITTLSETLEQFSSSQMISSIALFRERFQAEINALVNRQQARTMTSVYSLNKLVSLNIAQNQLISALKTNFYLTSIPGSGYYLDNPQTYSKTFVTINSSSNSSNNDETCSCSQTADCKFSSGFFNNSEHIMEPFKILGSSPSPLSYVDGMYAGCLPQNAILQSTLECLFSQACLSSILLFTGVQIAITPLNNSIGKSRFTTNTTIGSIFNEVMVESWGNVSNFSNYFRACAPQSCTYSYSQRFSVVYMITILISLFGGLNIVARTVSPLVIKFLIQKLFSRSLNKENNQALPASSIHQKSS